MNDNQLDAILRALIDILREEGASDDECERIATDVYRAAGNYYRDYHPAEYAYGVLLSRTLPSVRSPGATPSAS